MKQGRVHKVTLGGRRYGPLKETTVWKLAEYYKKAIHRNKYDIQVDTEKLCEILGVISSSNKSIECIDISGIFLITMFMENKIKICSKKLFHSIVSQRFDQNFGPYHFP